jgi:hypothetical protein
LRHGDGHTFVDAGGDLDRQRGIGRSPGHPFYRRLNELLEGEGFDTFVEGLCRKFYAARMDWPSLVPAVYFRSLLIGYFEGVDSESGTAWSLADSLGLREFVVARDYRYDTGGMRCTHLRKHTNILKRQPIHVAGFNLSLIFRRLLDAGAPREWKNLAAGTLLFLFDWLNGLGDGFGATAARAPHQRPT